MSNIYNLRPDAHDDRDLSFSAPETEKVLPQRIMVKNLPVTVFQQGKVGSCTAQSTLAMLHTKTRHLGSRLFLYYNTRVEEGSENFDGGATLRNTIKVLNRQGVPLEKYWQYVEKYWNKKPFDLAYQKAEYIGRLEYRRLNNYKLQTLKQCLADGNAFVFGFMVHENFDKHDFKLAPKMPDPLGATLGGHAVLCYGYDDKEKAFVVRNSWGNSWGINGDFLIPYRLMTSTLCFDFWTITNILDNDKFNTNNTDGNPKHNCFLANLFRRCKNRISAMLRD